MLLSINSNQSLAVTAGSVSKINDNNFAKSRTKKNIRFASLANIYKASPLLGK